MYYVEYVPVYSIPNTEGCGAVGQRLGESMPVQGLDESRTL